jgi:hypothetical protein
LDMKHNLWCVRRVEVEDLFSIHGLFPHLD